MDKTIAIVNGDQIHDAVIQPGTEVQELLQQLALPRSYYLSKRDGLKMAPDETIWHAVQDGEKLFASPPIDVGGCR